MPPPPGARIDLPSSFGRRFAIFGDAEEEFDWTGAFDRHATATTSFDAIPDATRRFRARGVVPTYMVDWPIVATDRSAAILAAMVDAGECEVGTQLHPWVNPPFDEAVNCHNSYTANLAPDLQRAKLLALTDRIERVTGVRPLSYRAGRYGIGRHTAGFLVEAGYRLDVSVRPGFDYRAQHGPNFARHPNWSWQVSETLYEVPLTTGFTGAMRGHCLMTRATRFHGMFARLGLFDRVPLTPEGVPLPDALRAIRRLLDDGQQLFSLSFHTPTVVPGHTPYVRNAAELDTFWRWWDGVFDLFAREGVTGAAQSDIIAAIDAR